MPRRYAEGTSVSVSRTRAEIEDLVTRYNASAFMAGSSAGRAMVGFEMAGRRVKFFLPLPAQGDRAFTHFKRGTVHVERVPHEAHAAWEGACRSRWRALLLCIKAKLEAVAIGISEFDDEFMANIVLPDGMTIGERLKPQIAMAYERGEMPPLLSGPTAAGQEGKPHG